MSDCDAVVVPGGGVRAGGELPPWVRSRLDRALEIAREAPIILLSAGTTHRPPPLDRGGHPIFESLAAAAYLLKRGYPRERLLAETASYDTIGNAYLCRVIHAEPAGFRRLAVVTSEFHMARTEAAFRWIFGAPLQTVPYALAFFTTPDTGMSAALLESRRAKERAALPRLRTLAQQYRTLPEIHRWLFAEHRAYAAGLPREGAADSRLLDSY